MENEKNIIGDNLKAFTFEDRLKQVISEAGLPVSTVYYILNNAMSNIKGLYDQQVNTEYNQYNEYLQAQNEKESEEPKEEVENSEE